MKRIFDLFIGLFAVCVVAFFTTAGAGIWFNVWIIWHPEMDHQSNISGCLIACACIALITALAAAALAAGAWVIMNPPTPDEEDVL